MLTTVIWKNLTTQEQAQLLQRPAQKNTVDIKTKVEKIINDVRLEGDAALQRFTKQYDNADVRDIQVSQDEFANARKLVSSRSLSAIEQAKQNLVVFHNQQIPINIYIETAPGIICETQARPMQRIGLYIPGGSAPLVSTMLMLGVPAQIAGCPVSIVCSPPGIDGTINPNILYAAELCGIEKVYKVGGCQAIAAMAYGTQTIPKVDKIFGPGNRWVTEAKMQVAQDTAGAFYDLPAGPSEIMVIADETANAEYIAADLLSQAEHGSDSQVILICTNVEIAKKVNQALQRQIELLPRQTIAVQALKNSSLILIDTINDAINIANQYAPEHLMLQIEQPRRYISAIKCAGSVFLGPWSPESAGDYASGTNHVLPTYGFAKALSGLSVRDFMTSITFQELTREGLGSIAETIRELTQIEGLEAHWNAVDIRLAGGMNDDK